MFVMGNPNLIIAVDHQPLTKIFNDRPMETITNPRVLQLKEKTLMYHFNIIHMPVKKMKFPDITSRNPVHSNKDDPSGVCEAT